MNNENYTDLYGSVMTKKSESSMLRRRRARRFIGLQESSRIEIINETQVIFLNNWLHRLARDYED